MQPQEHSTENNISASVSSQDAARRDCTSPMIKLSSNGQAAPIYSFSPLSPLNSTSFISGDATVPSDCNIGVLPLMYSAATQKAFTDILARHLPHNMVRRFTSAVTAQACIASDASARNATCHTDAKPG